MGKQRYQFCGIAHKVSQVSARYQRFEDKLKTKKEDIHFRNCPQKFLIKRPDFSGFGFFLPYIISMKTLEETTVNEAMCLRVGRVAEILDCSISKVYSLISDGHLETIKLSEGKKAGVRVLSSSLNRFLHEGGVMDAREMTPADKVNSQRHRYRRSSSEWF